MPGKRCCSNELYQEKNVRFLNYRSGVERLQDSPKAQCERFYHNTIAQTAKKKLAKAFEDIE